MAREEPAEIRRKRAQIASEFSRLAERVHDPLAEEERLREWNTKLNELATQFRRYNARLRESSRLAGARPGFNYYGRAQELPEAAKPESSRSETTSALGAIDLRKYRSEFYYRGTMQQDERLADNKDARFAVPSLSEIERFLLEQRRSRLLHELDI